jgi:ribose transport system substrate-binding protein
MMPSAKMHLTWLGGTLSVLLAANAVGAAGYEISLVTGEQRDPFYVTMADGAKAKAEELGVVLSWQAPTAWDATLQIPVINAVLASKPQFLIAVPDGETALIEPLRQFGDYDIPVLTVDTDVSERIGNITSDNVVGGELSAQELAKAVGESGKVVLLCTPPGITTGEARRQGFEATIGKYPGIDYVGDEIYNGTDPTDAARVTNAILTREADLAGMVACDGPSGLGAATAINESGKAGEIKLISFDAGPDLVAGLKAGTISALRIQQSYAIGATAVEYAVKYLDGDHDIPAQTLLPYIVGTKDNIDSPDLANNLGSN